MREIKFRGKDPKMGVWAYGSYVNTTFQPYIIDGTMLSDHIHVVDPESVGQCIGYKDLNGKDIFEGDIVKTKQAVYEDISVIIWDDLGYKLRPTIELPQSSFRKFRHGDTSPIANYFKFEIIGNVYDNPELIECEHE